MITQDDVNRLLELVDRGLCRGLGCLDQTCLEGVTAMVLDGCFSDHPSCVNGYVRDYAIAVNDCNWSSDIARSKGLRRLAVAQLGMVSGRLFLEGVAKRVVKVLPHENRELTRLITERRISLSVYVLSTIVCTFRFYDDIILTQLAECAVETLIELNSEGSKYLNECVKN